MGLFNSERKNAKRREKQQNIAKWNSHIRQCARINRIAQIQHLDDYLSFPSISHNPQIIMAKVFCNEYETNGETKKSIKISLYDENGYVPEMSLPIDGLEAARVFFKIIPFYIVSDNNQRWLDYIDWNHGSDYDCDDSYSGKRYVFADGQEDYDSSIETENDVFIQKHEIHLLSDNSLLYLANIIDSWRNNNFSEIVGNYDMWKDKKKFILGYDNAVTDEINKRGLQRFNDNYNSNKDIIDSKQFANYGEKGEKEVEYALKWLPNDYKRITRSDYEGIRLLDSSVSDESQEIDHIVIGPNGVFVIETKYLKGNIHIADNGNWLRKIDEKIEGIRNPIQQIDRHHMIIKNILDCLVDDEDIHDVICLAYTESTIDGEDNSLIKVVRSDMLVRYITSCTSKKKYKEDDINRIIKAIEKHRI